MSDNYTCEPGGVPAGNYPQAEFTGTEPVNNQYGEAVKLKWRIIGGQQDGQEATRICSPKLTPGNALGKMATALKGNPIAIGEAFSFSQYVGTRGSLVVEPTQNGGGRVSMFLRQQAPQATQPQAPPPPPPIPAAQPQPAPWEMQTKKASDVAVASQQPQPQPAGNQLSPEQLAQFAEWQRQQEQGQTQQEAPSDDSEDF